MQPHVPSAFRHSQAKYVSMNQVHSHEVFKMKCPSSLRIITNDMPVAADQIFIGHQSFQTDRSARMDLSGRNADLSAESVAEAAAESTICMKYAAVSSFSVRIESV